MQPGGARRRAGRPWSDRPERDRREFARAPLDELLAVLGLELAGPLGEAMLSVWLSPGRWDPPVMLGRRGLVLYLLSGAVLRSRREGGVDLLLRGDAVRMDEVESARWRVLSGQPARVAVVAPSTFTALAAVPGATQALMYALFRQLELELEMRSIVGIQRIEQRIVAFFTLLARRLGEPFPGGIRIPLDLEQKRIEEILSAGHTQSTLAFRALFGAGVLAHDAQGWRFDPSALTSSVPNSSGAALSSGPNSMLRV